MTVREDKLELNLKGMVDLDANGIEDGSGIYKNKSRSLSEDTQSPSPRNARKRGFKAFASWKVEGDKMIDSMGRYKHSVRGRHWGFFIEKMGQPPIVLVTLRFTDQPVLN